VIEQELHRNSSLICSATKVMNLRTMILVISQTLVDLGASQVWKAAADIIDAGSVKD
jgi:hypothetical protein